MRIQILILGFKGLIKACCNWKFTFLCGAFNIMKAALFQENTDSHSCYNSMSQAKICIYLIVNLFTFLIAEGRLNPSSEVSGPFSRGKGIL